MKPDLKKGKKIILAVGALAVVMLMFELVRDEPVIVGSAPAFSNEDVLWELSPNDSSEAKGKDQKAHFDLSKKAHYYDPETTMHFKHKLAWELAPFHPTPQEFQYIAQRLAGVQEVGKRVGDDAFFTPKGRRQWRREVDKLDAILRKQLGKDRYERYLYAADPLMKTQYPDAWRLVTANGLDEARAEDLRDLAIEYKRTVEGKEIDGRTKIDGFDEWHLQNAHLSFDEKKAIKLSFIDRIRDEFGEGVLNDILPEVSTRLFPDLNEVLPEDSYKTIWNDLPTRKRMEEMYDTKFISHSHLSRDEQRQKLEAHEKEMTELYEKQEEYYRLLGKENEEMARQMLEGETSPKSEMSE